MLRNQKQPLDMCYQLQVTMSFNCCFKLFWYTKNALIILTFIWMMILIRHLHIRPEYLTRTPNNSQKYFESQSNVGLFAQTRTFSKILTFNLLPNDKSSTGKFKLIKIGECIDCLNLKYFTLMKHQSNPSNDCVYPEIIPHNFINNILFLHTSLKHPSLQMVLSQVKSIYKMANKNCVYPVKIYTLSRKEHLLMKGSSLIRNYIQQMLSVINILKGFTEKKLTIIAFEESATLTLKMLGEIDPIIMTKINKIILINPLSPDFYINGQETWKYVNSVRQKLIKVDNDDDQKIKSVKWDRIKKLNETTMVFINTWKYYMQPYQQYGNVQSYYRFLLKKPTGQLASFANTAFIESRLIQGVNHLLSPRNYFVHTNFINSISKLVVEFNPSKSTTNRSPQQSMQEIYHIFYDISKKLTLEEHAARLEKVQDCVELTPHFAKVEQHDSTYWQVRTLSIKKEMNNKCVIIYVKHIRSELIKRNLALYVSGNSHIQIITDNTAAISPQYSTENQNIFIIQNLARSKTSRLMITNEDKSIITVRFILIHSPKINPIVGDEQKNKTVKALQYFPSEPSLIRVCPHHQYLLFPHEFNRRSLQKYLIGTQYSQAASIDKNSNCYFDINLFDIMPDVILRYWTIEVNIVLFTFVCSFISKKKVQNRYWSQLLVNVALTFMSTLKYDDEESSYLIWLNFLLITFSILSEKLMDILIALTRFPQEYVSINYQVIMILIAIFTSILKEVLPQITTQLSAYKILLLSIIFLVNPYNIILLIVKIYLIRDQIVYNHNSCPDIILICLLVYVSLIEREQDQKINSPQQTKNNAQILVIPKYRLAKTSLSHDYLLICGFALFIDGPILFLEFIVNFYIVLRAARLLSLQTI